MATLFKNILLPAIFPKHIYSDTHILISIHLNNNNLNRWQLSSKIFTPALFFQSFNFDILIVIISLFLQFC